MKLRGCDLALAALVLAADQATKLWADARLEQPITLLPGLLRLTLRHNRGALFSAFADAPAPWREVLVIGLPLIVAGLIVALLARTPARQQWTRAALALLLGGAAGNLADRILRGEVIDFIDVFIDWAPLASRLVNWLGSNHWPTFNVADAALTCGAAILIAAILRRPGAEGSADAPVSA